MADTFSEQVDPAAAIRSILQRYPYSVGLLREILQNSDDAKATKQIFVLDHRTYPTEHLIHEGLADLQESALLAFNDSVFTEQDWKALQNISQSSKRLDTSKIGKYGIGFRALYHVTDNPQILSHDSLVVFDPQHDYSEGGLRIGLAECQQEYPDQLSPFTHFLHKGGVSTLEGTAIRLPLRRTESRISSEVHSTDDLRRLLDDFVVHELQDVMLFLNHLKCVEVYEVKADGTKQHLGSAHAERGPGPTRPPTTIANIEGIDTHTCKIVVERGDQRTPFASQEWRNLSVTFSSDFCEQRLSGRLSGSQNIAARLQKEKLRPGISIAAPTTLSESGIQGRLFTFLPLPITTGFPCHIHALFALTDSRQNLRNSSEIGVVKGSLDELLVEWNRLIFDTFIPEVWVTMLEILADQHSPQNIYAAWPPPQVSSTSGEPAYWRTLLERVLRSAERRSSMIFPLICKPRCGHVRDILIAPQSTSHDDLAVLAKAGLLLAQPPSHIFDLLVGHDLGQDLNPKNARAKMLNICQSFTSLSAQERDRILCYLLTTGDLRMISDIPLIPLVSGPLVALRERGAGRFDQHIMLSTRNEADIFHAQSQTALVLEELPSRAADQLRINGPSILNVAPLCPQDVFNWVQAILLFHRADSSIYSQPASQVLLNWLEEFWKWLVTRPAADDPFPLIQGLSLLPGAYGRLMNMDQAIFSPLQTTEVTQVLTRAGLTFLHQRFYPLCRDYLQRHEIWRDTCNANDVLDALSPRPFTEEHAKILRQHLSESLVVTGRLNGRCKRRLRELHIYPVLVPTNGPDRHTSPRCLSPLPAGQRIQFVAASAQQMLLPNVQDVVFLPADEGLQSLVEPFDVRATTQELCLYDVIRLATDHFEGQQDVLKLAVLVKLATGKDFRTYEVMHQIKHARFLQGGDTSIQRPVDMVDILTPGCLVGQSDLVLPSEHCYPVCRGIQGKMVKELAGLGMLRRDLSIDFVVDRITTIARLSEDPRTNDSAYKMSQALLKVIHQSGTDCHALPDSVRQVVWLPIPGRQLCAPNNCRDERHREFFDAIMPIIGLTLPDTLRNSFGWDNPVPLDILIKQFAAVTEKIDWPDQWTYLKKIILEFGRREQTSCLDDASYCRIRELVQQPLSGFSTSRPWVPVLDQAKHRIVPTVKAIFDRCEAPGFYRVPRDLLSAEDFLRKCGCLPVPSNATLVEELHRLRDTPSPSSGVLEPAILLLRSVDTNQLSDKMADQLLLPDTDENLRRPDELYYCDSGLVAQLYHLPEGRLQLHRKVDVTLAMHLHIDSLSSLQLQLIDPDDDGDMKEELCTRINALLNSYLREQLFNELLANAADAGAHHFNLMLDMDYKHAQDSDMFLSSLHGLCSSPSVIVHNDSCFSPEDFKSIRNIGRSQKRDDPAKTGKFGLGALAMYHLTDIVMVISSDRVLFLDPARRYLPSPRTALIIPLKTIRRMYPVRSLYGLFGFSGEVDSYNGTIFWLPLRMKKSPLSSNCLSIGIVTSMLRDYQELARQSLFFTEIDTISAWNREFADPHLTWKISAKRHILEPEAPFTYRRVDLDISTSHTEHQDWYTASMDITCDIREEDRGLSPKHRREGVKVALAVCTDETYMPQTREHRLHATLPLPKFTSLPFHLHAPFILADDRRSIRFDGNGAANSQSSFNRWLLSEMIPRCLSFLLERWPTDSHRNLFTIWPTAQNSDEMSVVVAESFYTKLASVSRKICITTNGEKIAPTECAFFNQRSPSVEKILIKLLRRDRLVLVPACIRQKVVEAKVSLIDPTLIRDIILQSVSQFRAVYTAKQMTAGNVSDLLHYMLFYYGEASTSYLQDLPLLPTADDTLADISTVTSDNVLYYSHDISTAQRLFPRFRFRFLAPHINRPHTVPSITEVLENHGLNVACFDRAAGAVATLIERHVMSKTPETLAGSQPETWIRQFWSLFTLLPVKMLDIEAFPLVQTTRPGHYVSIARCRDASVMETLPDQHDVCSALENIGVVLIPMARLCDSLAEHLREHVRISIDSIMNYLASVISLPSKLNNLRNPQRLALAKYLRDQLSSYMYMAASKGSEVQSLIRRLPIWPAYSSQRLYAISDNNVHIFVRGGGEASTYRRFLLDAPYLTIPGMLAQALQIQEMSAAQLMAQIRLPSVIAEDDLEAFGRLLGLILEAHAKDRRPCYIKVPNEWGEPVDANQLYAWTDPIFRAVFESRPSYFLHHRLRNEYEPRLASMGLHNIRDFPAFLECARVLDEDRYIPPEDRRHRALQVYEWYQTLPMTIGHRVECWRQLDDLHFIPYDPQRKVYTDIGDADMTDLVQPLPDDLASPKELLRAQWKKIAWTQRAQFSVEPDERVLLANLSLGVPTMEEVVNHLRRLVLLGQRLAHDGTSSLQLLEDLTATYCWLNERSGDDAPYLSQLIQSDNELFLNVDDARQQWHIASAENLYFDAPDRGEYERVRSFLEPYKALLLAAGASEIIHVDASRYSTEDTHGQEVSEWRISMNKLRAEGRLADATFSTAEDECFPVHRIVLASASEYFRSLFCGGFRERDDPNQPISLEEDATSVEAALNYIYTGEVPTTIDEAELLGVLRLAHYWRLPNLHVKIQKMLINHISRDNYESLRSQAQRYEYPDTDIRILAEACDEFEKKNKVVLDRLAIRRGHEA